MSNVFQLEADYHDAVERVRHTSNEPVASTDSVAFQPIIHLDRHLDGSITIEVDWSNALLGEVTEDGHDDRTPIAQAAAALLDAWRAQFDGAPLTKTATFVLIPPRGA